MRVYQGVVDCTPTTHMYDSKTKAWAATRRLFNKQNKENLIGFANTFEEALEYNSDGLKVVYVDSYLVK